MNKKQLKIASEEQRLVGGEVYIPGVPDSDGEFMDAEGIRDMAYKFMKNLKLKMIDVRHNNRNVEEACVVESFIARKGDTDFIEGSWVVLVHVPDDNVWQQIKKGEINGFSMEAMVSKEPVELELDVPPVISGVTLKSDDGHEHKFHVAYDEDGNFLGGQTDIVNGHFHAIKKGTVTEDAMGHKHRFAHLDIFKMVKEGAQIEKADVSDVDLSMVNKEDMGGGDLATAGAKNPEGTERKRKKRLSDFCRVHQ